MSILSNKKSRKVDCEKPFIIYSAYVKPGAGQAIRVQELVVRLVRLKERYKDVAIVLYSDLNLTRDEIKEDVVKPLSPYGYRVLYNNGPGAFTRLGREGHKNNYLDYFIVSEVDAGEVEIKDPIGKSDHLTISTRIKPSNAVGFGLKKQLCINFGKIRASSGEISDEIISVLESNDAGSALMKMINCLKGKYKPRVRKPKDYFHLSEEIKLELRSRDRDFEKLRKMISSFKNEEYRRFMERFEHCGRFLKEYFCRLRFYSEIGSKVDILKNLDMGTGELITDSHEIGRLVTDKYKKLFRDNGKKTVYQYGEIITITDKDVVEAIAYAKDKAVS